MAQISATPFAAQNSDNGASSGVATDALVERLFGAAIDTLEVASVHIGGRLGFYRSLADDGGATSAELAVRTGTDQRYVREWLEQQAVAGFLSVQIPSASQASAVTSFPSPIVLSSLMRRTSIT